MERLTLKGRVARRSGVGSADSAMFKELSMQRAVFLASLGSLMLTGAVILAQQNASAPQPRADALPPPGPASPKLSRIVPKPEGVMPTVPAGFSVSVYA